MTTCAVLVLGILAIVGLVVLFKRDRLTPEQRAELAFWNKHDEWFGLMQAGLTDEPMPELPEFLRKKYGMDINVLGKHADAPRCACKDING